MQKMFEFWVLGTLEDAPIPHEVQNIIFCLHKANDYAFLSFGGQEILPKQIFNFEYYPLEAQFFALENPQNFSLFNLRKLLENALKNEEFSRFFYGKTILFGLFESTEIFELDQ